MAMDQGSVEADCRRAAQLDGIPAAEIPDYVAACLGRYRTTSGTPFDPAADAATASPASGSTRGPTAAPNGYGPNWQDRIGDMDAPPEHRDW
jgi:hypothetical protein